jgi:hypothetical protein
MITKEETEETKTKSINLDLISEAVPGKLTQVSIKPSSKKVIQAVLRPSTAIVKTKQTTKSQSKIPENK